MGFKGENNCDFHSKLLAICITVYTGKLLLLISQYLISMSGFTLSEHRKNIITDILKPDIPTYVISMTGYT